MHPLLLGLRSDINNSMLIEYGKINTSNTYVNWTQPKLTSNGTLGGDSFAIYSTVRTSSSDNNNAYIFFDGVTTQNTGMQITNSNGYLIFYNPIPLKVSNLTLYSRSGLVISKYTLSGSNDNSNWTTIGSYNTNTNTNWSQDINNNNSYKYYKIDLSGNSNNVLIEIDITATYLTIQLNSITFPMSFSNTYYGFSYCYVGGIENSSYLTSKTTSSIGLGGVTGMASSAYWIACGY